MSDGTVVGKAIAQAPVNVGTAVVMPIDPNTGWLGVSAASGGAAPAPTTVVYSTLTTAGGGTGFETQSVIPAGGASSSVTAIIGSLSNTAAASRWIQLFLGVTPPGAGDQPFIVLDSITPPGGNFQFDPPEGLLRSSGFIVVLSTTQYTFTSPGAVNELRTRALGRA